MLDPNVDWTMWTDWRWTAVPISTIAGLHGSLLLVGPLGFLGAIIAGKTLIGVVLIALYAAYLFYCARKRRGPYQQLVALYIVHVAGCQWRAR